jgi:hypothetical protein
VRGDVGEQIQELRRDARLASSEYSAPHCPADAELAQARAVTEIEGGNIWDSREFVSLETDYD